MMIAEIFVAFGCLFILISTFGLIRLPDPLSRIHAIAKITSFGLSLMTFGALLKHYDHELLIKAMLVILFLILTSPLAAHAIAQFLIDEPDDEDESN